MDRITPKTPLAELKARLRLAEANGADRSERLILSVQQSLHVEGYDVRAEVLREALQHVREHSAR
jgi:hypothetical protein